MNYPHDHDPELASLEQAFDASTLEWLALAKNYVEYANEGGDYADIGDYLSQSASRGTGKRRFGFL
jgi:hypothetical protein